MKCSDRWNILCGDCLDALPTLEPQSVHAVITDPPYGLRFMGAAWDHDVPGVAFWQAILRVAKPGAHLLAFGGTRTWHRLACAIEDAGFEIRDTLMWVYGQGFPKSHDVSKALDKAAGVDRPVIGMTRAGIARNGRTDAEGGIFIGGPPEELKQVVVTVAATTTARAWSGWGTGLKPAWEPILLCRRPPAGPVARNVLEHGCGGLNIDACRIPATRKTPAPQGNYSGSNIGPVGHSGVRCNDADALGRWPANVIHDGSPEVLAVFPDADGGFATHGESLPGHLFGFGNDRGDARRGFGDNGSAARFFYAAKASRAEREAGLREGDAASSEIWGSGLNAKTKSANPNKRRNNHPAVKPVALLRWLCRLVTPPDGLILDPFCGSGSTGVAAIAEGFRFVGIELDSHYSEIARARCAHAVRQAHAESPLFCPVESVESAESAEGSE